MQDCLFVFVSYSSPLLSQCRLTTDRSCVALVRACFRIARGRCVGIARLRPDRAHAGRSARLALGRQTVLVMVMSWWSSAGVLEVRLVRMCKSCCELRATLVNIHMCFTLQKLGGQIRSSLVVVVGSKVLARVLLFSGLVVAAVCPPSTSTPCGASFTSPQVSFVVRVVCPHPRPSMCLQSGPNVDRSVFRADISKISEHPAGLGRRPSRTTSKHKMFPQMNLSFRPRGEARKSVQKAVHLVAAVFHLSRDGWLQHVNFVSRLSMSFGRPDPNAHRKPTA